MEDVRVVNQFNIGSDHRLIKTKIKIVANEERKRLHKANNRNPKNFTLDKERFQHEIETKMRESHNNNDIEEHYNHIVSNILESAKKCKNTKSKGVQNI